MTDSEENGGGSENVVQRNSCSRETLKFRKMFKRSVLNLVLTRRIIEQVFQ